MINSITGMGGKTLLQSHELNTDMCNMYKCAIQLIKTGRVFNTITGMGSNRLTFLLHA